MRYFKLITHLTMPRTLSTGVGATHHRPRPGDVIALEDAICFAESRFVNGRVRAGDFVETDEAAYKAAVTTIEPETSKPAASPAKGK